MHRPILATLLLLLLAPLRGQDPADPPERNQRGLRPMLVSNIERPLRYTPEGRDFVIHDGPEFFNRPLYGGSSAFRVDAGDRPEFSLYLPGRGGNLRLGLVGPSGAVWLHQAARIETRYRAGMMLYTIRDPLLGSAPLHLSTLATRSAEGLLLRVDTTGLPRAVELVLAFGGINGERGGRDGDIGTERLPVREFFQLRPEHCENNHLTIAGESFAIEAPAGRVAGLLPPGSRIHASDASGWNDLHGLLSASPGTPSRPIAVARVPLTPGTPCLLALQHVSRARGPGEVLGVYRAVAAERSAGDAAASTVPAWTHADLPRLFATTADELEAIARRVTIDTPDPFVDAAMSALNVAADAVWDDRQKAWLHGGVAWRVRLLGWRVAYAGDTLGWHDRTRAHFDGYAAQQNISPVPEALPPPEASANLARNETALHSNGDMTKSHYDMNMVGVDTFFRHLLWTGDLAYARASWPVIERHLAWERRLFRREFGPEALPLYEAYACIWASDDLTYHGGGATHSSAYNLYHNRMAARVARLLGVDPAPYEREASLLARGMQQHLWLADRGWYAEWKDLLGLQLVHPQAAAWTFYHTLDSGVPDALAAWQMTRYVDTSLPRLPLRGAGVPEGCSTLATTNWMPWTWSLNNVVLGETAHSSLAYWQADRPEAAYPLLKGALLDSMYLGICPGNVGMCTWLDAYRRESQRDFGDGIGILARTMVEGLFGITPDMLAGEVQVRPGFPAEWEHAAIEHPDFGFRFRREGTSETFLFSSRFARPPALRLEVAALRDDVASATVNGVPATWSIVEGAVGRPRIVITAGPAAEQEVVIVWRGNPPAPAPVEEQCPAGAPVALQAGAGIARLHDPQSVLTQVTCAADRASGVTAGRPGHRTLFALVHQGSMAWWQPLPVQVVPAGPARTSVFTTQWNEPVEAARLETVPMSPHFNDSVDRIFRHDYLSPRSPFCSLAVPKQGYGSWCKPTATFAVDDSGLRAAAAKAGDHLRLPNGVPLQTPGTPGTPNILFVSQWDNFPREATIPLSGRASMVYLLMAGSTWAMQSRIDNGEILVRYADGTQSRLALENPTTWWPIDQDYFIDDFAFARPGPLPVRVDLKTGKIRVLDEATFAGRGRRVDGGAATVLDLQLDPSKELHSLTLRALANEVVIGLMSATLQRP